MSKFQEFIKKTMRNTTWQGWLFLAAFALIIAGGIVYAVSEYTANPHKGQVQETWAAALFFSGVIALLVARAGAGGD